MGLNSLCRLVFAFNVLAIYHAGFACSVPRYWRTKGVSRRAIHADIVIVGKVVQSPYKRPTTRNPINTKKNPQYGPYNAQFKVICELKGSLGAKYVNVSGFGYIPGHCVTSHAIKNETYITLLRVRGGRYFVAEINSQVATIPLKKSTLRKVAKRLARKGKLNKSRNGCAACLRRRKKAVGKFIKNSKREVHGDAAYMRKSNIATTEMIQSISGLSGKYDGGNGAGLNSLQSVIMCIVIFLHCVGWLFS